MRPFTYTNSYSRTYLSKRSFQQQKRDKTMQKVCHLVLFSKFKPGTFAMPTAKLTS